MHWSLHVVRWWTGPVFCPLCFPRPSRDPWPLSLCHQSFTLSRCQLRMCMNLLVSSDLLFSDWGFLSFMIHNFSVRQTSHVSLPPMYPLHSFRIFYLMLVIFFSFVFLLPYKAREFGAFSLFSVPKISCVSVVSVFEYIICAPCVCFRFVIWYFDCGFLDYGFTLAVSINGAGVCSSLAVAHLVCASSFLFSF